MKKYPVLLIIFICCFLAGCAKKSMIVSVSPDFHKYNPKTFAILPFTESIKKNEVRYAYPNAVNIMTDIFKTSFMRTGYKMADPLKIKKAIKEVEFSYESQPDKKQLKDIGVITDSDVVISGLLLKFTPAQYLDIKKPKTPTKCTTISLEVKAFHIESGEVLWKVRVTKSTGIIGDLLLTCNYDVLKFADEIAGDIVKEIIKQTDKNKKVNSQ